MREEGREGGREGGEEGGSLKNISSGRRIQDQPGAKCGLPD